MPGGEQIVKESYAQMRKFNCWNISTVQQYSGFKESRIRSDVFGNSRQFFLMRQNDRGDLEDMSRDIGLTELTKHAILSYPLPHPAERREICSVHLFAQRRAEHHLRHRPQRCLDRAVAPAPNSMGDHRPCAELTMLFQR